MVQIIYNMKTGDIKKDGILMDYDFFETFRDDLEQNSRFNTKKDQR